MTNKEQDQNQKGMDTYLEVVGGFGKYQKMMFLLLSLPTIVVSMQKMAWVFLAPKVDHRCRMWWEENATYPMDDGLKELSYPWDDQKETYDQCLYYSNVTMVPLERANNSETLSCGMNQVYDTSKFRTSAVIDYGLVCDRAWLRATVQSTYMVGMLLGSYVMGDISDRVGRKPVFLSSLVVMVVVGVGQVIIPHYAALLVLRLLLGAALQGIFLVTYVMSMEMVGKRSRSVVGVVAHGFYSIGFFVTALLAWLIPSWHWLQVTMTLPALFFIPYYWIIPESSRWLITKGRTEEAQLILEKVAKVNKKKITEDDLNFLQNNHCDEEKKTKGTFLDLFRLPTMRLRTLNIFFNWSAFRFILLFSMSLRIISVIVVIMLMITIAIQWSVHSYCNSPYSQTNNVHWDGKLNVGEGLDFFLFKTLTFHLFRCISVAGFHFFFLSVCFSPFTSSSEMEILQTSRHALYLSS